LKARVREFTVVRAKLAPKPIAADRLPPPVVDQAKAEEKRRERRIKALAVQAFRSWKPGE
jgi:hypothetical protein